jgi:hypothetical protein
LGAGESHFTARRGQVDQNSGAGAGNLGADAIVRQTGVPSNLLHRSAKFRSYRNFA